jgi:hypothetical protein
VGNRASDPAYCRWPSHCLLISKQFMRSLEARIIAVLDRAFPGPIVSKHLLIVFFYRMRGGLEVLIVRNWSLDRPKVSSGRPVMASGARKAGEFFFPEAQIKLPEASIRSPEALFPSPEAPGVPADLSTGDSSGDSRTRLLFLQHIRDAVLHKRNSESHVIPDWWLSRQVGLKGALERIAGRPSPQATRAVRQRGE